MNVLVIAPHPDDETIGAGGTIAKHVANGDDVYLCIVTRAYSPDWHEEVIKEKRKEVLEVSKILGIKKTYFLNLPTVKLDTIPQKELNDHIFGIINKVQPQIVYTTHRGDINKDHRLVFDATMVATRPIPGRSVKKVLSYELLSSTEWTSSLPERIFVPNVYVDISDTLKDKVKAFSLYKSEVKEYPHPRSLEAISIFAKKRGTEVGLKAAEAFILLKEIWD